MPKVKVTSPSGYFFQKKKHAEGDEIDHPAGAHLDAALHFDQVEVLKVKPEKPEKSDKDEKDEKPKKDEKK